MHAVLWLFAQQVGVVDVVQALASLMRRSNRTDRIQPSDIVSKLALQHGVDALVRCAWSSCCFCAFCCELALDDPVFGNKCTGITGTVSRDLHNNDAQFTCPHTCRPWECA